MTSAVKGIVIVGAKRTAFGTFGGKLANTSIIDLQATAAKAVLASSNVKPELVDTVVVGNVLSSASGYGIFLPRTAALKAGIPIEKPALAVNRLCGSGFQAIVSSCQDISNGMAEICLAGGVDSMSLTPFIARNMRFGVPLGQDVVLEDSLWVGMTDPYCDLSMAMTAEKLGSLRNITRDQVDEFSLKSQQRWKAAQDAGFFKEEIVPLSVKVKNKTINFEVDEHPRPTTLEGLKNLKPRFKENGLVTAGTASGISDGAAALVLASDAAASKHNLKPLARILSYSVVGVEPSIMGIGPVPAITTALKAAGKSLNDVDLVEINEAFAAQTLACVKDLNLDTDKLNVNGGAIALGHPLGASGARIMGHLVHELRRRKAKLGVGSACIGGGQGIAVVVESL
ncbi:hypothetical protein WA026_022639 [Henosepilachna vigintioctopunctata]|uniref:3-ketoacyl-CoA thiolase, mitochondrial n=1 Tax=Henosepilachna vigintioctopunctata TaxID=420089 RepID=A0AAW1U6E6_9CUCU